MHLSMTHFTSSVDCRTRMQKNNVFLKKKRNVSLGKIPQVDTISTLSPTDSTSIDSVTGSLVVTWPMLLCIQAPQNDNYNIYISFTMLLN